MTGERRVAPVPEPSELRVVFMGTPEFAVPSLRALGAAGYRVVAVYTQPDRPGRRGRRLAPPPVKVAAEELGLPVRQPERLHVREEAEALTALTPDLIVVAAYGQILRPAVIDLPRYGCLNVHASLLPRWRGAACISAAILAGDDETGVSLMRIDPGLDTGPVLARRAEPIQDWDTTGTLTERLAEAGAQLLLETLPGWLSGSVSAEEQDDAAATYAPRLDKSAGELDWQKPAVQLWREVRAYNPWPLSNTRFNGEQLQILAALPLPQDASAAMAAAGSVVDVRPHATALPAASARQAGFAVQTGDGLLVPLQVRRAGRPAVTGAEFARGARGLIGSSLG